MSFCSHRLSLVEVITGAVSAVVCEGMFVCHVAHGFKMESRNYDDGES